MNLEKHLISEASKGWETDLKPLRKLIKSNPTDVKLGNNLYFLRFDDKAIKNIKYDPTGYGPDAGIYYIPVWVNDRGNTVKQNMKFLVDIKTKKITPDLKGKQKKGYDLSTQDFRGTGGGSR
jgi:hypothetical protein